MMPECAEHKHLLDHYVLAVSELLKAGCQVAHFASRGDGAGFDRAVAAYEEANRNCVTAHSRLAAHVQEHGCESEPGDAGRAS